MTPGFKFFWVHNVDLDEWCARYELEVFVAPCTDCEAMLSVHHPFVGHGGVRGLGSLPCDCGSASTPFTFTSDELQKLA